MNGRRVISRISPALLLLVCCLPRIRAQPDSFTKNFKKFQDIVPGIDFFSGSRADLTPFEKPVAEAQQKLAIFLGKDLAKGVVVVCSTLEQKDSVDEARVLRTGYKWVLIQLTPEASNEQMLAQIKAQMGGQLPPGIADRFKNQSPEMKSMGERRLVASTVQRVGHAIISTTLAPNTPFRSSRLDDMGRSPLADWLDIGLAAYAAGGPTPNLRLLQERLEEAFPLEDVLSMSRPFVAPSSGGSAPGGPGMVILTGPGGTPAPGGTALPPPSSGGDRVTRSVGMPKDVQDRMTFDAQAASFFAYLLQKTGIEKLKELLQWNREGKPSRDFVTLAEVLGPDLDNIEKDWQAWVKQQKVEGPEMRIITGPKRPER